MGAFPRMASDYCEACIHATAFIALFLIERPSGTKHIEGMRSNSGSYLQKLSATHRQFITEGTSSETSYQPMQYVIWQ